MYLFKKSLYSLLVFGFFCFSCQQEKADDAQPLFELMDASQTGIGFSNNLSYTERFNPYTFRNFYNGAGVALGDINNDGLVDILFAGNQTSNKLYLNKGDFVFEDITEKAGLAVEGVWSTGVSMADINGDGFLDIYVCKSGPLGGDQRHNELFINNGDLTFTEKAKDFGIADEGLSQHAVFFDYDKDGDLDMYLLNNSARSIGANDLRAGQREVRDPMGGNKLYRNDGNKFTDVSEQAGIYGSAIGYGLGVTVADLNKDGWVDLYVSNDFFEKDYLYLNNGDGTFREALEEMMAEISMGSMGADIADLDNDGWQDIFVTEMLPATLDRVKSKTPFEEWDKYQANVKAGYYHQFTRNTLQRNMGFRPGTDQVHFVEIARQAGVHATDWSWGALIFDMDNDGLRDIFVANGIVKDLTDFDYVDYYVNKQNLIAQYKKDSVLLTKMIDEFPSVPQQNFLFKNKGNFSFENVAASMGMDQLTFSTGAAYADLDNDGDLDLVVNNLNGPASLFKNNSSELLPNNYLMLDLGGKFGAQVEVYAKGQYFFAEHNPVKGYMSSVDHRLHFGLGTIEKIDTLKVWWPDGTQSALFDIPSNQLLKLDPSSAVATSKNSMIVNNTFFQPSPLRLPFRHEESDFVDFDRDRLRFWMVSNEGPRLAIADINGDGWDDVFFPGPKGQASSLWVQDASGSFMSWQVFDEDALTEDVEGLFFDADNDGDLDLYVVSGGLEFSKNNPLYQDRIYLNDGKGKFVKAENLLPQHWESSAFVKAFDFNKDGRQDLLVGERTLPFAYGIPMGMRLLENKGQGRFQDVTFQVAPSFKGLGMLRDAALLDMDGDGQEEIVAVGEWMGIKVFKFRKGKFEEVSKDFGFSQTNGLWQRILVEDFDGDGLKDLFVGNWGLNSRMQASAERPMRLYVNDFDQNGSVEQILTVYEGGKSYPLALKQALLKQLPGLKKILLDYAAYKDKTMEDLFPKEVLVKSTVLEVHTLESRVYRNTGKGNFEQVNLPSEVQYSPVFAATAFRNVDGSMHLLLGGNQRRVKPEIGIQMGSYGWHLKWENNGFQSLPAQSSGWYVQGEIRDIQELKSRQGKHWLVSRNGDFPLLLEKQK